MLFFKFKRKFIYNIAEATGHDPVLLESKSSGLASYPTPLVLVRKYLIQNAFGSVSVPRTRKAPPNSQTVSINYIPYFKRYFFIHAIPTVDTSIVLDYVLVV